MIQQKYCIVQLKEYLYEYENGSTSIEESKKTIENLFGSKVVRTATSAINERDAWEKRQRERRNRSTSNQTDREWRDNGRVKYSEKLDQEYADADMNDPAKILYRSTEKAG